MLRCLFNGGLGGIKHFSNTLLGIECTGVLGILLEAKSKGLIAQVKPLLDQLRISGFWMREQLYNQVLNLAHE